MNKFVGFVTPMCFPLQILQSAINSIAVKVSALHAAPSFSFEGAKHQEVNQKCFSLAVLVQSDLEISMRAGAWLRGKYSLVDAAKIVVSGLAKSLFAPYAAAIANGVQTLIPAYFEPAFFHPEVSFMKNYTSKKVA